MEGSAIPKNEWSIDQIHSEIGFKVRHLMIAHARGTFKDFDAHIFTRGRDFQTAEIEVLINATSIHTGDVIRDEHLRSPEFLDTHRYPQISFRSTSIQAADKPGDYTVRGELTLKGKTKSVQLLAYFGGISTDPWDNEKAGFSITGTIQRSEWGLVWNTILGDGGLMVSDEVVVSCEIELINATAANRVMNLQLDQNSKEE